ncbi:MAG: hypothetical protein IPL62_20570 [Caulobacteraceae bacterium]|nr:hypothetical protein [Caulobacteraceae bacterium]
MPEADRERTVAALLDLGADATMLVYGTVLPWKGVREKFGWSEHHRVIAEQCAEWLKLRDLHADAALCIAGDYNTDLGTGAYYGTNVGIAALRSGLENCDLFCATAPEVFPTGWLPYPPIDHIALPSTWKDKTTIVAACPPTNPRSLITAAWSLRSANLAKTGNRQNQGRNRRARRGRWPSASLSSPMCSVRCSLKSSLPKRWNRTGHGALRTTRHATFVIRRAHGWR